MSTIPITYTWTGEEMKPLARFMPVCDRDFVVGQTYRLDEVADRSRRSHDHYFACLHDAWLNLPEIVAHEFLNETKFRKWALIEAGYCDETRFRVASSEDAMQFATALAGLDTYARVDIYGEFVSLRRAKSQSKKAMGAKVFQESKEAVLEVISKLIGVNPADLKRNAGMAA